jgi:quercetin dioxygenase-like cupin family protein
MEKEALKQKLSDEGYPFVYEWRDEPDTVYKSHKHSDKVAMFITQGSVTFDFLGTPKVVSAGERFDVPVDAEHTAVVGRDGCEYVVGQMNEDD